MNNAQRIADAKRRTIQAIADIRTQFCDLPTTYAEAETIYVSLRRMEKTLHYRAIRECNWPRGIDNPRLDRDAYRKLMERHERQVERWDAEAENKFLPRLQSYFPGLPVLLNGDPRGYAIKINDDDAKLRMATRIESDMGGYALPSFRYGE